MKRMKQMGKIQNVGYDKKRKQFLGFSVVPEVAFKNTHPDELLLKTPDLQI